VLNRPGIATLENRPIAARGVYPVESSAALRRCSPVPLNSLTSSIASVRIL
jgi:hypothetical protein